MLVSLTELMKDATAKNYAVGAFNATNLESLTAAIGAAEETGKAIILPMCILHLLRSKKSHRLWCIRQKKHRCRFA